MIIAQGGAFAGWTLYAKEGKPTYRYNLLGLQRFKISGDSPIPAGDHLGGWSSPTTEVGSPKVARSPSMSTGARWAKVVSKPPCR